MLAVSEGFSKLLKVPQITAMWPSHKLATYFFKTNRRNSRALSLSLPPSLSSLLRWDLIKCKVITGDTTSSYHRSHLYSRRGDYTGYVYHMPGILGTIQEFCLPQSVLWTPMIHVLSTCKIHSPPSTIG